MNSFTPEGFAEILLRLFEKISWSESLLMILKDQNEKLTEIINEMKKEIGESNRRLKPLQKFFDKLERPQREEIQRELTQEEIDIINDERQNALIKAKALVRLRSRKNFK